MLTVRLGLSDARLVRSARQGRTLFVKRNNLHIFRTFWLMTMAMMLASLLLHSRNRPALRPSRPWTFSGLNAQEQLKRVTRKLHPMHPCHHLH